MSVKNLPIPVQGFDDHDSFSLEPQYGTLFRNVRSNRRRIERAPGGTLMAPPPAQSLSISVVQGSFQSPLVTGSVVYSHLLGVTPKAFMFAASRATANTIESGYATSIGFSDLTTEAGASHAVLNNTNVVNSWKGYENFSVFLIDGNGTELIHGIVSAVSSTTFTINWTVVDATKSYTFSYTTLGGAGLSAKVVEWQSSGSTGNQHELLKIHRRLCVSPAIQDIHHRNG